MDAFKQNPKENKSSKSFKLKLPRSRTKKQLAALDQKLTKLAQDLDSYKQASQKQASLDYATNSQALVSLGLHLTHIKEELTQHKEDLEQQHEHSIQAFQQATHELEQKIAQVGSIAQEAVFADVFNHTTEGCEWLKGLSLSPGRWAVGYQFLYALFRTLEITRPKTILDLGLGQSSSFIARWAETQKGVKHIIVEHDQSWIDFYKAEHRLVSSTEIVRLDLEMAPFEECINPVRRYKDFAKTFAHQKFDLISIDAPLGSDMPEFARIDVFDLIPESLSDSFVILMDDVNRPGEKNTDARIHNLLDRAHIDYAHGYYHGAKTTGLTCSKDLAFLATM